VQGLLEHVADLALAHGAADVHRHRRHQLGGDLLLDEEVADLGPVAVCHDDAVALGDHLGDAPRRAVDVDELLLEGPDLAGLQDGVAAQGDDDGLAVGHGRAPRSWVIMQPFFRCGRSATSR